MLAVAIPYRPTLDRLQLITEHKTFIVKEETFKKIGTRTYGYQLELSCTVW